MFINFECVIVVVLLFICTDVYQSTVEYGYIENGYIEKRIYRTDFDFPARALLCKTKFPTDISKTDISKNGYIEHVFDFLTTDISNWPLRFYIKI